MTGRLVLCARRRHPSVAVLAPYLLKGERKHIHPTAIICSAARQKVRTLAIELVVERVNPEGRRAGFPKFASCCHQRICRAIGIASRLFELCAAPARKINVSLYPFGIATGECKRSPGVPARVDRGRDDA